MHFFRKTKNWLGSMWFDASISADPIAISSMPSLILLGLPVVSCLGGSGEGTGLRRPASLLSGAVRESVSWASCSRLYRCSISQAARSSGLFLGFARWR